MKQMWIDKVDCSGCNACKTICPAGAIIMTIDDCGFRYPVINDNCIACNLCEKTCYKQRHISDCEILPPKTYAAWSKDEHVRFHSTSGGLFTEIAKQAILKNNAYVCAAKYNKDCLVEHDITNNIEDLQIFRQSKYLQSDVNDVYVRIKELLSNGEFVFFCSTPCQINGITAYLLKDYENLLTADLICRGVSSPKAYKSWINEIEEDKKSKVKKVWFKYKEKGWKKSPTCTKITFEDDEELTLFRDENIYMTEYLKSNLSLRPSCANCHHKGFNRSSDITLADFWKVEQSLDDDKGTSIVTLNTAKGMAFFENIQDNIQLHEKPFESILTGNKHYTTSIVLNKNSVRFLKSLTDIKYSEAVKKYK